MSYRNEKLEEFERYIKGKKIAIIGIGVSNIPLLDYFQNLGALVTVFDKKNIEYKIVDINRRSALDWDQIPIGNSIKYKGWSDAMRTLIFYKSEYIDEAKRLRDNYIAHLNETDIICENEQDDIEYARKNHYDEAIFIEDENTVVISEIKSGFTNRCDISDVYFH